MLEADGLTVKLVYEDGNLWRRAHQSDSNEGDSFPQCLRLSGIAASSYKETPCNNRERVPSIKALWRLKDTLTGRTGHPQMEKPCCRSIRCLDANICQNREIAFFAFNHPWGIEEFTDIRDSRSSLLPHVRVRFPVSATFLTVSPEETAEDLACKIKTHDALRRFSDIPYRTGMVLRFDAFPYSAKPRQKPDTITTNGIASNLRMNTLMKQSPPPLSGRQDAAAQMRQIAVC